MEQTSTQQKLLLYAYNELPAREMLEFRKLIDSNSQLRSDLDNLRMVQARLDTIQESPHPTNIQIVLEESRNSQLEIH